MTPQRKLLLLGSLYLAQGLPFGFFTQALPVLLRQADVSLEAIGMSAWLALPWGAKFLWAPIVDRTLTRRQWILGLQALSVALCLFLGAMQPDGVLLVLMGAVLLTNFLAATQDIATDGLAVSLLTESERGWGNSLQVAGYRVGMIIGGGALLVVYDWYGWWWTFTGMGALLALATVPLWRTQIPSVPVEIEQRSGGAWSWVWLPGAWKWSLVLGAYKFGDYMVGGMLRPWLVDADWSAAEIGALFGGVGFTAGLVGALLGGAVVSLVPRRTALVGLGLLQTVGLVAYAAAAFQGATVPWITAAVIAENLLGGMSTVALFTCMMDASRTSEAGTDYTVQASIVVVASGLGNSVSGWVAASWGFPLVFALGALLSLLGPALASTAWATERIRATSAK